MKTKIAIAVNYPLLSSRIGGMDRFFWKLEDRIKEKGLECDWYFPWTGDIDHYKKRRFKIIEVNESNFSTGVTEYLQHQNIRYDVFITHFIPLFSNFHRELKRHSAKYVVAVDHMSRPLDGHPLVKKVKLFLRGIVYRNSIDCVIAVCEYIKREIIKDFGSWQQNKIVVIKNGIDLSIYRKIERGSRSDNKIRLFNASRLVEEKGLQHLLKALSEMDENLSERFELKIAGDGPYYSVLYAMIRELNLTNVELLGNRPNVENYLAWADMYVQPTYQEANPLTYIEAIVSGIPVLTSDVGGVREILDERTGLFVPPRSSEAITKTLESLINSPLTWDKLQQNVKDLNIEKFDLNLMVDSHWLIIESFINYPKA